MDFKTFSSMDPKSIIITILISLFITAIAYLFVPSILCIAKVKLSASKIKTIAIVNGIVVAIVFVIIESSLGNSGSFNFMPAILWSSIAYALMKKFCLYTEDDIEEVYDDDDPRRQKPVLMFSAMALLITSLVFNIVQYNNNSKLINDNIRLEKNYDEMVKDNIDLQHRNNELSTKASFYDENIVFVIEGYGNYYFTYDKMMKVTEDDNEYSYWAYNKEQAIAKGYVKFIN